MQAPPALRGHAQGSVEMPGEVRLVTEPALLGDPRQWLVAGEHPLAGPCESAAGNMSQWRDAEGLLEGVGEVTKAEPSHRRQVADVNRLVQMRVDMGFEPSNLPVGESTMGHESLPSGRRRRVGTA